MNIHDYTISLLKKYDCNLDAYRGDTFDDALNDLREVNEDYPFPIEDIAKELIDIGNSVPQPPEVSESWEKVGDWGYYAIGEDCLYEDNDKMLDQALQNGDFDTGWHGFKKEIESMRIVAFSDTITVEVSVGCDDMPDLIYDFVDECSNEDEVMEMYYNSEYNTEQYGKGTLPRNSSREDILIKACELAEECRKSIDECCEFVKGCVNESR